MVLGNGVFSVAASDGVRTVYICHLRSFVPPQWMGELPFFKEESKEKNPLLLVRYHRVSRKTFLFGARFKILKPLGLVHSYVACL